MHVCHFDYQKSNFVDFNDLVVYINVSNLACMVPLSLCKMWWKHYKFENGLDLFRGGGSTNTLAQLTWVSPTSAIDSASLSASEYEENTCYGEDTLLTENKGIKFIKQ